MRKYLPVLFYMMYCYVCLLVVMFTIPASSETGCMEPEPITGGSYEFGASAKTGDDGLYPVHSVVVTDCFDGYQLKGIRSYFYCSEDGQWTDRPTCQRTQTSNCPIPKKPWNGMVRLQQGKGNIVSFAIYSCKAGFRRSGPGRQHCVMTQKGIKWRGRKPECRASRRCTSPGMMHGANWTLDLSDEGSLHDDSSFSPNTRINITCWKGFVLLANPQTTCGMRGTWSPPVPTCQEVICPSLRDREATIEHLQSNMENRTYTLGEVIDYQCDDGYQIQGKSFRVCSGPSPHSPNQTWTDLDPVCTEVECPHPGIIQYGSQYLVSQHIGGNVTFSCYQGYQLQGSAIRHCLPTGKWSGTLTTCNHEDFDCPNPGIPIGGYMVNMGVHFREGETVLYKCNGNRALIGSAERECTSSRTWTGEPPMCQGPFDFDDPVEIAGRIGYKADSLSIDTHVLPISNNSTGPHGRSIDLSYTGGMDIYFVFDASGSIPKDHFQSSLNLAKALVRKIGVARGARYGAVMYASFVRPTIQVSHPQHSLELVLMQIDAMAEIHGTNQLGRGTATGMALRLIHTDMIPASDRPNAKKILFLFTDGKTNMGGSEAIPEEEAKFLKTSYNVEIYCIGVGSEIDSRELQEIASKPVPEHFFRIKNYPEVNLLAQALTGQKLDFSPCGYNGGQAQVLKHRIAGGEKAVEGEWPWQVALFCQTVRSCDLRQCVPTFFCGGSLIARNWVLTAAHCLAKCPWSDIVIYTGILDKSTKSLQQFNLSRVYRLDGEDALIKHEGFNKYLDNDIALLRLSHNATLSSRVRLLCMPQPSMTDSNLYSTSAVPPDPTVVGWGTTKQYETDKCKDRDRPTSPDLKQLVIPVISDRECRQSFKNHYLCSTVSDYKPDIAFCAGYADGGLDACKGDSGGPVMRKLTIQGSERWVQIGIVSWGEGCAVEGRYGIYTKLSTYRDWIRNNIGNTAFQIHNY